MKVVLLSGAHIIHTTRWANGLVSEGIDVYLISIHPLLHYLDPRVNFYHLKYSAPSGYILASKKLGELLSGIQPDILNAHYATGYGLLARLTHFKPLIISVWGSDIYQFPEKSFLHRWFLRKNLRSATSIASTSECMARKTKKIYPHQEIFITPFGINENKFNTKKEIHPDIIIGTVKTLKHEYGIDTLIKAFFIAKKKLDNSINIKLEISGSGKELNNLKKLASTLGVLTDINFHGHIKHEQVPIMLNRLDIYVALSRSESFGVAILEACSCKIPVIVSNADGPAEVVIHGKTGFIVPMNDEYSASQVLMKLIKDSDLRINMGKNGRRHVLDNYTWSQSIRKMIAAYAKIIKNHTPLK